MSTCALGWVVPVLPRGVDVSMWRAGETRQHVSLTFLCRSALLIGILSAKLGCRCPFLCMTGTAEQL
jgi:hypothetical protein